MTGAGCGCAERREAVVEGPCTGHEPQRRLPDRLPLEPARSEQDAGDFRLHEVMFWPDNALSEIASGEDAEALRALELYHRWSH